MTKYYYPFLICLVLLFFAPSASAEDASSLWIYAVNAGYKDDNSSQNYDFIELRQSGASLSLADYSLVYFNSAGNEGGRIVFNENQTLSGEQLVLGFAKSPQYVDYLDSPYTYNFGSSGLASTAGKIQLLKSGEVVDEICWGKPECIGSKFATDQEKNRTLVRHDSSFEPELYYPGIIDSIDTYEPPADTSCDGLIISEIHTYYTDSPSEQFIELYNSSSNTVKLASCQLVYKNKSYPLGEDELAPSIYYVYRNPDLTYTKDPTNYNLYALKYAYGDIFYEIILPHGQKKGTSYAIFNSGGELEQWLRTYSVTPGTENTYQEFQTCEAGKVINPETGNCIKEEIDQEIACEEGKYLNPLTGRCKTVPTVKTTTCKDGYYLNPETGRCKKYNNEQSTECQDGYERNPETNRCRKIRTDTAQEYPVTPVESDNYDNPKIFIATGVIIGLALLGLVYAVYQYRKEIKQFILKVCRRNAS